jgi:hypothetical protein
MAVIPLIHLRAKHMPALPCPVMKAEMQNEHGYWEIEKMIVIHWILLVKHPVWRLDRTS